MIELRILEKVAKEVGHGIPIQELFDLVIGTSTGILRTVTSRSDACWAQAKML